MAADPQPDARPGPPPGVRPELRLQLAARPYQGPLGGAWWPRSRDLAVELAQLIEEFPPYAGRLRRIAFCPADWDDAHARSSQSWSRFVTTARGRLPVAPSPHDDGHVVVLVMGRYGEHRLPLMVVPSDLDAATARLLMTQGCTPGNRQTAAALLQSHRLRPGRPPRR